MKTIVLLFSTAFIISLFSYNPKSDILCFSEPGGGSGGFAFLKSIRIKQLKPNGATEPRDFRIPDVEDASGLLSDNFKKDTLWEGPRLVVIDPGHGGAETGAVANGLVEKEVVLDISKRVDSILKTSKILTYMIRKDDSTIHYKERISTANSKKAALYVSIHCDWYKDPAYNGPSTLYYPSSGLAAGNLTVTDFARIIQDELIKTLKTKNKGIIQRTDLAVLNAANMPSILVEVGFLSNKSEAKRLASESFRQKAAEAIASGIIKALQAID